jgi:hypothetical protein
LITTLLAILFGVLGAFLVVWPISIRRLSVAQQPAFSRSAWFAVVPLFGFLLFLGGFGIAIRHSWLWSGIGLVTILALAALLFRHDQYSAMARILFDDYLTLKKENAGSSEFDLLYSIVKSRKPHWNEDRIMEFCAGKDIKQVVLLLLVLEYEIHPLNDMQLYQRLKMKVEASAPQS